MTSVILVEQDWQAPWAVAVGALINGRELGQFRPVQQKPLMRSPHCWERCVPQSKANDD
jgi:hypothetical protein